MKQVLSVLGLVALWAAVVLADDTEQVRPYEQCAGQKIEGLQEKVTVEPCGKSRCKLKRGINATITLRFKPDHEVKNLINDVQAIVSGAPLPFIGVTGNSACGYITNAETKEPVNCPLKPDVEYIYTNSFPIETFYPTLTVRVHYALKDGNKDLICFEVPAKIV